MGSSQEEVEEEREEKADKQSNGKIAFEQKEANLLPVYSEMLYIPNTDWSVKYSIIERHAQAPRIQKNPILEIPNMQQC